MKRFLLALLTLMALLGLGFARVGLQALVVDYTYTNFQNPVEQQAPAVNPTDCAWDFDDRIDANSSGTLAPGERWEYSRCINADWAAHLVGLKVYADKRAEFRSGIEMTSSDDNLAIELGPARQISPQQLYTRGCIVGPDYDHETTKLLPVEGSNGGVAIPYQVTWWAQNIGERTIRDVALGMTVRASFGSAYDEWCPSGFPVPQTGYDPRWGWSVEP